MNKDLNSIGFTKKPSETTVVVAMSGGVDSSTVAGMMKKDGSNPCIVFHYSMYGMTHSSSFSILRLALVDSCSFKIKSFSLSFIALIRASSIFLFWLLSNS